MAVNTEITRIESAKDDLKTALNAKGAGIPDSALLSDFSDYVANIGGMNGEEKQLTVEADGIYIITPSDGKNAITKLELTVNTTNVVAIAGKAIAGVSKVWA